VDISIRPARPEDAKLIAWCMLMAGRSHMETGIWDLIISQPEDRCLAFLEMLTLQEPRHMCHYTEFLVAEVDGHSAAALEGFDPVKSGEATVAMPMAAVIEKMGLTEQDMAPGQQNLAAFMTCHPEFADGAWIIEHVATRPGVPPHGGCQQAARCDPGQGGRSGLSPGTGTDSISATTPAERAYKKAGFKYADEKRHPDFEALIGCPGMVRLLRDL